MFAEQRNDIFSTDSVAKRNSVAEAVEDLKYTSVE